MADALRKYTYSKKSGSYVQKETRAGVDYSQFATKEWALLISFFRWYPDIMEDICKGDNPEFENGLVNRVMKRYMARYQETFTTGTRGLGKTSTIVADKCDKGIVWPGEITGYYAPVEKQAAPLASAAFATYSRNCPVLAAHWVKNSDAQEHFKASTKNGSQFIMSIDRGINTSGVVAEECAQEDKNPFNFAEFNQVVLGTNRLTYKVGGKDDPTHIDSQIHYITSATRKENEAFPVYMDTRRAMMAGESAFALSIPWQVPVLCRMKSFSYYQMLKKKLTAEQFMRECESKWTGSIENPIIKDADVQKSRVLKVMEDKHCGDPDVFYILGYDVSFRDRSGNAMTAMAVVKCSRQFHTEKKDYYRKQLVYVEERKPPATAQEHAALIKRRWKDYCMEGGTAAYIILDAQNYGEAVLEALHTDLGDGNPPMCTMTNDLPAITQPGAIPCVYPMRATYGTGGADPNSVMLDYAEREFENGNVQMLTASLYEGTKAYKLKHGIKDDRRDIEIQAPYSATNRLCRQIANLQKKYMSVGWTEQEISKYINKDMWSAFLYALRLAQRLEKDELYYANRRKNEWEEYVKQFTGEQAGAYGAARVRSVRRQGRAGVRK